ncbi:MAG: septum formation inhibitor Maf [Oscillospiraceae bacterium]|jgi:septum formation protein|nr:septum formation inhibitor Maf [Oscillospiraceae bacterium]MBQ1743232.1 septum formation inhibitor Maf [Oscillospiraceae bacterium]MBQ1804632.1 septum formation inhibitor Maf [Oscillospiraceae bacterium]MBQ2324204.1 septum formation inhibitor Maf [Oscillospiraceae bacterium]MBQ2607096.1 septum formation inhibitor Maf [Oscillospiraceae bacterium]
MPNIVLASQSPRRQELLRRMGIEHFSVVVPNADESYPAGLSAQETVSLIARKKADAAARLASPDDIVITADTMVFLDDERLGKPHDEADALRMLTELSGRAHTVCTGVTVRRGDNLECFTVSTEVYFRSASRQELLGYIATGEPMDKAGAYGIQGLGALFIERINGDYYNVMGLPIEALGRVLQRFGVTFF